MKRCVLCGTWKPLSEFNRKRSAPDGKQDVCRGCNRQVSRDYYARNREKHVRVVMERNKRVRRERVRHIVDYLTAHPCVDCGETDPVVLEFDHLQDKVASIAMLVTRGASWRAILAEIAKCDVVCCNCHRRRSAIRGDFLRLRMLTHRNSQRHLPRQAPLWIDGV